MIYGFFSYIKSEMMWFSGMKVHSYSILLWGLPHLTSPSILKAMFGMLRWKINPFFFLFGF